MPVKPPRQKMPPLNALRAFEAAARLGGIARAADELCVTPGAVAQHLKALEGWAGAPLFHRHAKGVTLNPLGQGTARDFSIAFAHLSAATQNLRIRAAPNSICIAALPSLAQLWLSPRMPALRAAFPQARISITALEQPPNLEREGYDLGIFLEQCGAIGGVILAQDRILPVCAPAIADRIKQPVDLANHPWLQDSLWQGDWHMWLQASGNTDVVPPETVSYSLFALAVAEASNGAGILMGHDMLVASALSDGALVAPLGPSVPTGKQITARLRPADARALPRDIVAKLANIQPEDQIRPPG